VRVDDQEVSGQDHIVEIIALQHIDDVRDVCLKIRVRRALGFSLPEAGQADRPHIVPELPQPLSHVGPGPRPKPRAAHQNVGCHRSLLPDRFASPRERRSVYLTGCVRNTRRIVPLISR
jgi:hypothetical protein